jgi:molecular chaperone HscC
MIIGIDLGTTNSLVAVWQNNDVTLIPNASGNFLTPSVISVCDDMILIGEPALNRLVTHPDVTVANFKRYMGSDQQVKLANYRFRPEELSAFILKQLKEDAEAFLGHPVQEAVISVPAYFSDAQRKATKIAGKLAGLNVERLINEPTAAGIAYGLQEQVNDTNYLIFDLGGGTFDVSILTMFSGIVEVHASSGDNLLGGIDFTRILEDMFLDDLRRHKNIHSDNLPAVIKHKIREQAELAKYKLSIDSQATIKISMGEDTFDFQYTEKEFEQRLEPLFQRLRNPIKKVLNDAKLSPSQIDQIVLVGGASRMRVVKQLVGRMFGKLPLCHVDPDTVVVRGVAIQAGLKAQDQALDDLVVTDVCPYSLGIEVYNDNDNAYFDPIIERNMGIPFSRSRTYYPLSENQRKVTINIYQGESYFIEKNVFLGSLNLELPRGLKNSAIDVRFTYDINGLLEVEATLEETKQKQRVVIEGHPGILTEKQIAESLESLKKIKIHPREKTENMITLGRADRLYEELQGEQRLFLGNHIQDFVKALNDQDPRIILRVRDQLEKVLDYLQNELSLV